MVNRPNTTRFRCESLHLTSRLNAITIGLHYRMNRSHDIAENMSTSPHCFNTVGLMTMPFGCKVFLHHPINGGENVHLAAAVGLTLLGLITAVRCFAKLVAHLLQTI